MQSDEFHVFDTTLRDGAQREGISYSVADKLAVARLLDQVGVGFIEGGWPGAMPKDTEFFARAADGELKLEHAVLVAFGATRKAGVRVEDDAQVRALVDSRAPVVTLVAKSDVRHVERALRTSLEENLAMVRDTVAFLRAEGRRVFVDCEHFFDGYRHDPDYGVRLLDAAAAAGADVGVLCDTNGGMLPMGVQRVVVSDVAARAGIRLGIHTQDDTGCAVANTLAAVDAGATHVQGTANGYGERAGNAEHLLGHRRAGDQDGPRRAAARTAWPNCSASRTRSPSSPTWLPTPTRPTSAPPRSRTRPACTPRPSRSTRSCTTTSTPLWWATPSGSSSPRWPGGRRSS